jgi:hypothetical protein
MPNYTVGAGRVFLSSGPVDMGERYVGNSSGFSFSPSVETLDTYASRNGVLVKDNVHVVRFEAVAILQLDDISTENLMAYMLDDTPVELRDYKTQASIIKLIPGHIYFMDAFDIRSVSATYQGVAFDLSDLKIDHEMGSIEVPYTADIYEGQEITVSYICDSVTVPSHERKTKPFVGTMRYIEDNLAGRNRVLFIPKITLLPDSEIDLKASSWRTLALRAEITSMPIWLDRQIANDYDIGDGVEDFGNIEPFTPILDDDYGVL